ncbi:P2Y purinoceptor 2-like [Myxocyprinus asiaticus]|uniref:P2Y purinoceptor 2-like n=1 Tax=Myxocyprinus asiaticus TaxID=70543 RepID=UPI0022221381|nr:P2Y purinoceptor 2-like [Myxocyprinus asiaticus]
MATLNNTGPTNNSNQSHCVLKENFKYILLPISYSLVFVVGLALNFTAMYIILFRTKHWKPSTIYMINLNICDTLYILTLPFLIYYYADEDDWPFSEPMCKLIRFLFYTNLYGSILFLSCISLHRFLGICHPVRSLTCMNARFARLVSLGIWVTLLIFQAPILYFAKTRRNGSLLVCYDTSIKELFNSFLVYTSVVMLLLFILPFGVVLVCNVLMVRKLQEPSIGGNSISKRSKQKSVKMIMIVLITFMSCFLPFHLNRSIYYGYRYLDLQNCMTLHNSNVAYKLTRPLLSLNSCIDPILYFMVGQSFRNIINKKSKSSQRCDNAKFLSALQLPV